MEKETKEACKVLGREMGKGVSDWGTVGVTTGINCKQGYLGSE